MQNPAKKITWQERVHLVHLFHTSHLKEDANWTIAKTAKELNRSIGRVSEDLTIVRWMRTYPQLEKMKSPQDALEFIKKKKREMEINGL